jgi:hypothetical protein
MCALFNSVSNIPVETSLAACKVYNRQHIYLRIGDQMADLLSRLNLPRLDPTAMLNDVTTVRLGLISAFQFAENLSDQSAVDCTRNRIDWKYALYLPQFFPGIKAASISNFRANVCSSNSSLSEFRTLLNWVNELGLFNSRQKTNLDPVLVTNTLNHRARLETLNQAMANTLSLLVSTNGDWLRKHVRPHWYECYANPRVSLNGQDEFDDLQSATRRVGADIARLVSILNKKSSLDPLEQAELDSLQRLLLSTFQYAAEDTPWQVENEPCPASSSSVCAPSINPSDHSAIK